MITAEYLVSEGCAGTISNRDAARLRLTADQTNTHARQDLTSGSTALDYEAWGWT
jgi:hypothetical protein